MEEVSMTGLQILGIFLAVWGVAVEAIAVIKPAAVWKLGKIQGFIQLMGDTGTTIFFVIIGLAALGGGIALIIV